MRMYHSDLVGVFHGRVFEIFEEARTEAFRRLGYEIREAYGDGLALVVTAVGARFSGSPDVDEVIRVGIYVDAISRVQLTIGYDARRETGQSLFSGEMTFVFLDRERGKPVRLPAGLLAAIRRCPGMVRVSPWPVAVLGPEPDAPSAPIPALDNE
jgi:acyl-CoA thioester hydrolase